MKQLILWLICFSIFSPCVFAEDMIFVADPFCPYICEEENHGFMYDILKEIFEEEGYRIRLKIMHWKRAIKEVKDGRAMGISGIITQSSHPYFLFPNSEIAEYRGCFFAKKGSNWKYEGYESLLKVQVGLLSGYNYGISEIEKLIKEAPSSIQLLSGENYTKRSLLKVLFNRIDTFLDDRNTVKHMIKLKSWETKFQEAGCLSGYKIKVYVGFSSLLKEARHYVSLFDQGMDRIRKSGELKGILAKYGLKDWGQTDHVNNSM